jgi:hypothetical protein
MPLLRVEAFRRAFFSVGGAYGNILFCSRPPTWRFQTPTLDPLECHAYMPFNLAQGSAALELPPLQGSGMSGALFDAWQRPVAEIGEAGIDEGRGGRFILEAPDRLATSGTGSTIPLRTFNGYLHFRMPVHEQAVPAEWEALLAATRMTSLGTASAPWEPGLIDIVDTGVDVSISYDDTLYDALARMVGEELVDERDLVAMAQMRSLGIVRGQAFAPDASTRNVLRHAAAEAHAHLMKSASTGQAYWPYTQWVRTLFSAGKADSAFIKEGMLEIDERGAAYYLAHANAGLSDKGNFSVMVFSDVRGLPLSGEKSYRLRVPIVPAHSWTIAAYDIETASFLPDCGRLAVTSADPDLLMNEDGSVDISFAPQLVTRSERNWIQTNPNRQWFGMVSLHDPAKP